MKRTFKAFLCGLLAFALANAASVFVFSDDSNVQDGMTRFGFPFFIEEQGPAGDLFSAHALFGDAIVAVFASTSAALVYNRLRHRHRFHHRHPAPAA